MAQVCSCKRCRFISLGRLLNNGLLGPPTHIRHPSLSHLQAFDLGALELQLGLQLANLGFLPADQRLLHHWLLLELQLALHWLELCGGKQCSSISCIVVIFSDLIISGECCFSVLKKNQHCWDSWLWARHCTVNCRFCHDLTGVRLFLRPLREVYLWKSILSHWLITFILRWNFLSWWACSYPGWWGMRAHWMVWSEGKSHTVAFKLAGSRRNWTAMGDLGSDFLWLQSVGFSFGLSGDRTGNNWALATGPSCARLILCLSLSVKVFHRIKMLKESESSIAWTRF